MPTPDSFMAPIIAITTIILMVGALSVFGPQTRPRPPAHLRPRERAASRRAGPLGRLTAVVRARPPARLALTAVSALLLAVAIGTIGYPAYTNLQQDRLQARLDRRIESPELRAAYVERTIDVGDSLTRLSIPELRVDVVVVEGTTDDALRAGAGHYADTPLPCEIGNVAIAGHRTTYGRPFHNLDQLAMGDEITLATPIGSCTYELDRDPFVVSPQAVEVLANTPDEATLTLTTCHPKGSARQRLIVTATLVRSTAAS